MAVRWIYCGKKNDSEYFTCIDEEDYEKVKDEVLHIDHYGYPMITKKKDGKTITTRLHKILCGEKNSSFLVEHLNNDFLDNRKINLKVKRKNEMPIVRSSSQGYTKTEENKYIVRLKIKDVVKYIGTFQTEIEARAAFVGACIASGIEVIPDGDRPDRIFPTELERQEAFIIRFNKVCENIKERAKKSNMNRCIKIKSPDGTIYPSVKSAREATKHSVSTIINWAKNNKNGWSIVEKSNN